MSLTYTQFVTDFANMLVVDPNDANYQTMLPNAIDYAEQRIYRELDILNTIVRDTSANTTPNTRNFTLPQAFGRFVTTQGINLFTPSGTQNSRVPLVPTTRDFLDYSWPSDTAASSLDIPQYYAMITDQTVIFGPSPGMAYTVEVVGTIRPTPLSSSNPTTYLTLYLPDLFLTAACIWGSAYLKNFGAQADQPQMAMSWQQQYDTLVKSANVEEMRKKYQSTNWSSLQPSPIATPPRA